MKKLISYVVIVLLVLSTLTISIKIAMLEPVKKGNDNINSVNELYEVIFVIENEDITIDNVEITIDGYNANMGTEKSAIYMLPSGEYEYIANCDGYETLHDTIFVDNSTITITLNFVVVV